MARAVRGPCPASPSSLGRGEGLSTGLQSQQEVVSTAHNERGEARSQSLLSPATAFQDLPLPKGWSARRVWQQPSWAADDGPVGGGKSEEDLGHRTWTVAPAGGSWRWAVGGCPHCCLHADSLRILLLVEQALRVGLEAVLARRSALDLVLSWADSVPFMHTALGRPRLCSF